MKSHFEYMPLPLSIAINSAAGTLSVIPAAFRLYSHDLLLRAAVLVLTALLISAVNLLVCRKRKTYTRPDLTVSVKSAYMRGAASAAAALLPLTAVFCDKGLAVPMICTGLAVFVFAFTLHFTCGSETRS